MDGRQKKLLKRMVASPMPRWQYLTGFLLSRLGMLVIEVVVFLGFARVAFGVPFRGPLWRIGAGVRGDFVDVQRVGAAGGVAGEDDGSSERAHEPGDASDVDSVGGVFLGDAISGGDSAAGEALPLTAAIDAMRGNMLQGMQLGQMMAPMGILLAWLVLPFAVSLWIFRWR